MTQVSSELSVAGTDAAIIHSAYIARIAGVCKVLSRAAFDAAVTAERLRITNNGVGIYVSGERLLIIGEVGTRVWNADPNATLSHGRTCVLPSGLAITLAGDANTITPAAGVPASGGNSGDISVDLAAGSYYVKGASAWGATATGTGGGGAAVVVINDLTTGGATAALSAAQGVTLQGEITANSNILATKGAANGFATLDGTAKIPFSQIPSLSGGSA